MPVRTYSIVVLLVFATGASVTPAFSQTTKPIIILAGHERWKPVRGWIKGDVITVMSGHPRGTGESVVREKIPPNSLSPVHYHPMGENNTVISGTFYIGFGDKADASKAIALPQGSFVYIPPGVHHFAMTKAQGALIETSADGPFHKTILSSRRK